MYAVRSAVVGDRLDGAPSEARGLAPRLLPRRPFHGSDGAARFKGWKGDQVEQLHKWVPLVSVAIMTLVVILAIGQRMTLWGLLIIKFEILIQLSPAFIFGTLHDRNHPAAFTARDIFPGLVVGLLVTLTLHLGGYVFGWGSVYGLHFGTVGVMGNYAVVLGRRWWRV